MRLNKKHGKKTARTVVAPLVLSLAFVAMTGLAPQYAAATPLDITTTAPTATTFTISNATTGNNITPDTGAVVGNSALGITATGDVGTSVMPNAAPITIVLNNGAIVGSSTGGSVSAINGGNGAAAAVTAPATGAGGAITVQVSSLATFAGDLSLTGGTGTANGAGGSVTLNDAGTTSVTTMLGDLNGLSGATATGGAVNVNIGGTMQFVDTDTDPTNTGPSDHFLAFTNTGSQVGGKVNANIGTLELVTTGVMMNLAGLTYATGAVTNDNVDIGTLKLTNGGVFTTNAMVRNSVSEYTATADQQYTVRNLHVVGGDLGTGPGLGLNHWFTNGAYTPADTGGDMIFDVTNVTANETMLVMDGNNLNLTGIVRETNGAGDAQLKILGTDAFQRGLIGNTFALATGVTGIAGSQWATTAPNNGVVRYYSQVGGVQYNYDTRYLDVATGAFEDGSILADGVGVATPGKAYSQYQAAAAETAADVFLNNTWVANRDVADITQPGTFGLTGRVSYFTINQDQDHRSEADKDQLAAAISGGWKFENGAGETTLGAFFEYGHGEYDTDTRVRGWAGSQGTFGLGSDKLRGDGDADLFGGGLFVYHDFMEGTYLDGGFRFGNVDQTYRIKGHGLDHRTKIDTDTSYWGVNFGVGHKFQLTDCANLDLYGKFLWTQFDGNSFNNGYGDRIQMDTVDSIRTRVGARVTQGLGDGNLSVYYGAAWEQEWDGEATGKYSGYRITEAADNSGASAFGELGLSYKPQGQNFAVEAGVFGLAGSQQGGGGTVGLKFNF